jgi:hypothetical protein
MSVSSVKICLTPVPDLNLIKLFQLPSNGNNPNRSVLVFFHAGGWFSVSGVTAIYGPQYLMDQNIVLVTTNYRLAALGKPHIFIYLYKQVCVRNAEYSETLTIQMHFNLKSPESELNYSSTTTIKRHLQKLKKILLCDRNKFILNILCVYRPTSLGVKRYNLVTTCPKLDV